MIGKYHGTDLMIDVIGDDYRMLQVISRFGITLGFGDQTVAETCKSAGVDLETFLTIVNYLKDIHAPIAMRIIEDSDNVYCLQPVHKGDSWNVPKIIEEAAYSVEGSFYSSREPHLSIEGDTIQTYYDEDDNICVQCKSQGLYGNMYNVSVITGQPLEKMRMIMNPTGASFGWSMWPGDYALCVDRKSVV